MERVFCNLNRWGAGGGVESTKKGTVNKILREEIISQAGICRKSPETKTSLACQRNREEAECVPKDKGRERRKNRRGQTWESLLVKGRNGKSEKVVHFSFRVQATALPLTSKDSQDLDTDSTTVTLNGVQRCTVRGKHRDQLGG